MASPIFLHRPALIMKKINATVLYLKWLKNWLTGCYEVTNEDISRYEVAKIGWLKHQLTILNKPFKLIEIIRLTRGV